MKNTVEKKKALTNSRLEGLQHIKIFSNCTFCITTVFNAFFFTARPCLDSGQDAIDHFNILLPQKPQPTTTWS